MKPISSIEINKYKNKLKENGFVIDFDWSKIKPFTPQPTNDEYNNGFIERYFYYDKFQKKWRETDLNSYDLIPDNLTPKIKLYWKISGTKHTQINYTNNGLQREVGVSEFNEKQIKKILLSYPNFNGILKNTLQFFK